MKAFVVDDQENQRELMRTILGKTGLFSGIHAFPSAIDALRRLLDNSERPDIIISDYQMPDVNGVQLLRTLREADGCKDIPFVLVSSNIDPLRDSAELLRERGEIVPDAFLAKPFFLEDVEEVLLSLKVK